MNFSDIQAGDTLVVTTAARVQKGFGGKVREIPAQTVTVQVLSIESIAGQPDRKQAHCTVLVTAEGADLSLCDPLQRPRFTITADAPFAQSFARA